MDSKLNLFDERDWLSPSATKGPVLWIREVRLLYRLEPDEKAELRRVVLRRGVNLTWAKPADPDETDPSVRGRGHDAGKSSFYCLIHYQPRAVYNTKPEHTHGVSSDGPTRTTGRRRGDAGTAWKSQTCMQAETETFGFAYGW